MYRQLHWQRQSDSAGMSLGTRFARLRGVSNRATGRQWLAGVGSALLLGCLSPTMPMPPPSRPEISGPDERGVVVLSGHVPPASMVYADNQTTGYSYGRRSDFDTGVYRLPILASVGDNISLFYRFEAEDSMATTFRIPKAPSSSRDAFGGAAGASASGTGGTGGVDATGSSGYAGAEVGASAGEAGGS